MALSGLLGGLVGCAKFSSISKTPRLIEVGPVPEGHFSKAQMMEPRAIGRVDSTGLGRGVTTVKPSN